MLSELRLDPFTRPFQRPAAAKRRWLDAALFQVMARGLARHRKDRNRPGSTCGEVGVCHLK
jgi:hypothetical protein